MKNWNTIGKIKAAIITVAAIFNLFNPFKPIAQEDFLSSFILNPIAALILSIIFFVLSAAFVKREVVKPNWNDNPLSDYNAGADFFAYLFVIVGSCMMISTGIKYKILNSFGLISFSLGLGVFIGIFLSLKILKKETIQ